MKIARNLFGIVIHEAVTNFLYFVLKYKIQSFFENT